MRHFDTMYMTVENAEQENEPIDEKQWHAPMSNCDAGAEHKDGQRNAKFAIRKQDLIDAYDSPNHHRTDKCCRHHPYMPPADLRAENTDGHHGKQMIRTKNRMRQASDKSTAVVGTVRKCRQRRASHEDKSHETEQEKKAIHFAHAPLTKAVVTTASFTGILAHIIAAAVTQTPSM